MCWVKIGLKRRRTFIIRTKLNDREKKAVDEIIAMRKQHDPFNPLKSDIVNGMNVTMNKIHEEALKINDEINLRNTSK